VPGTAGMSAHITLVDEKSEIGCDPSLKRFSMAIPSTGETLPGAKQGSLAWRPFIILCTFIYKFISKLL
jgi:hypothetical protein